MDYATADRSHLSARSRNHSQIYRNKVSLKTNDRQAFFSLRIYVMISFSRNIYERDQKLKLGEMSFAKNAEGSRKITRLDGSLNYKSPEILKYAIEMEANSFAIYEENSQKKFTQKSDIWYRRVTFENLIRLF